MDYGISVGDIRVYDTDTICVLMHSYRRTDHSACVCVCVCVFGDDEWTQCVVCVLQVV